MCIARCSLPSTASAAVGDVATEEQLHGAMFWSHGSRSVSIGCSGRCDESRNTAPLEVLFDRLQFLVVGGHRARAGRTIGPTAVEGIVTPHRLR